MKFYMKTACLAFVVPVLVACGGSGDNAFSPVDSGETPVTATSIHDLEAPRDFDFSTQDSIPVQITLTNTDGSADVGRLVVLHSVVGESSGSPQPGIMLGAGLTDVNGVWIGDVSLPVFDRKVYVQTPTAGYAMTQLTPNAQGIMVLSLTHP